MPKYADHFELVYAKDRKVWRKWLEKNHDKSTGIWLVYYTKDSGKPTVTYAEAVEEALCFGWIDSTANKLDDESHKQMFTPRKAKSVWSKLNKTRINKMIAEGQMTDAGMAKIDAAKKDGSWTSLDAVEALEIPPDLKKAFAANKVAKKHFEEVYSTSLKKMILYRISMSKRQETRDKFIAEVIEAANEGKKPQRYVV
jgi:Uncharacterized protein conserved in bacteria